MDHIGHIDGVSGKGKSTIFEAIIWTLYGKGNNVYNYLQEKATTRVVLKFEGFKIIRQRAPTKLEFISRQTGRVQLGQAQAQIEQHFGTYQVFLATSYIRQEERHLIFSSSARDRMKLLSQIAFSGQEPEEFLLRIDGEIKSVKQQIQHDEINYKLKKEAFHQIRDEIDGTDAVEFNDDVNVSQLRQDLKSLSRRCRSLKEERDLSLNFQGKRQFVEDVIADFTEKLEMARREPIEDFDNLQLLLSQASERKKLQGKIDYYNDNLRRLDISQFGDEVPLYTQVDLDNAINSFRRYSEIKGKLAALGIVYDPKVISQEIEILRESIESAWMWRHAEIYDGLETEIKNLEKTIHLGIDEQEVIYKENIVRSLEFSRDILACPGCKVSLRHTNHGLVLAEGSPFDFQTYSQSLEEAKYARYHHEGEKRLQHLRQQLSNMMPVIIPPYLRRGDTKRMKSRLDQLRQIPIIDLPPIEAKLMKIAIDYHTLQSNIRELQLKVDEFSHLPPYEEILTRHTRAADTLDNLKSYRQNIEKFQQQLTEIQSVRQLETINQELEIVIKQGKEIKKILANHEIAMKIDRHRQEKISAKRQLIEATNKLINLEKLRKIAKETQIEILEGLVGSINSFLARCSKLVFDEPMSVEISLLRKIKGKKKEKAEVNFSLRYLGGESTGISSLSGGEKSRLSTLMALAFNRISGSKLLILDETFFGMDASKREELMEVIRREMTGKSVIITCQEICKGQFDYVIDLN